MQAEQRIIEYYENSEIDYRLFWKLDRALSMHYGYWDANVRNLGDALRRLNEVLSQRAEISAGDRVLDAGCGVGGSAVFLAERFHGRVHGITLAERQVRSSRKNARRRGVDRLARFSRQDFRKTRFRAGTFDVVWAIESVCYARNKNDFFREAFRLLKPGGRLVVADFLRRKGRFRAADRRRMRGLLRGWAVPRFAEFDRFRSQAAAAGFQDVSLTDETREIFPSARRLVLGFPPAFLVTYLGQLFGIRNRIQTANVWTAYYQYATLKRDMWRYGILSAKKPGGDS